MLLVQLYYVSYGNCPIISGTFAEWITGLLQHLSYTGHSHFSIYNPFAGYGSFPIGPSLFHLHISHITLSDTTARPISLVPYKHSSNQIRVGIFNFNHYYVWSVITWTQNRCSTQREISGFTADTRCISAKCVRTLVSDTCIIRQIYPSSHG